MAFSAIMADGSATVVSGLVTVTLTIGERSHEVDLRVLPNGQRAPYILLGRELISWFEIDVIGNRLYQNGKVYFLSGGDNYV